MTGGVGGAAGSQVWRRMEGGRVFLTTEEEPSRRQEVTWVLREPQVADGVCVCGSLSRLVSVFALMDSWSLRTSGSQWQNAYL